MQNIPDLSIENSIDGIIAGIDEAGRGPLAGPVVAAAVILDKKNIPSGINDSKKTNKNQRENLFEQINASSHVGIGIINIEEIDKINILNATKNAMANALNSLITKVDFAIVDGNQLPKLPVPGRAIVKGDGKSLSIAAASIIAKVTRDRIMLKLHEKFPQYGWDKNSGYGTKQHLEAIQKYGITEFHRRSFAPIKQFELL